MVVCPSCGEENPDRFRLCGFCGAPLTAPLPAQEVRKTVTVVFCDLKGSTSLGERLDSESLREVMTRYFEEMRGALEEHGGLIEKYIGDAIMAVFGLPRIREDDALRAVRGAAEMKRRLAVLNDELERRWGVTPREPHRREHRRDRRRRPHRRSAARDRRHSQRRRAPRAGCGRAGNADRRADLQAGSHQRAGRAGRAARAEGQGRARARLPAARCRGGRDGGAPPLPLVGRAAELATLESELETAVLSSDVPARHGRRPGGRRQVAPDRGALRPDRPDRDHPAGALPPYGRGITFWPLVEIVREAASIDDEDAPTWRAARSRPRRRRRRRAQRVASAVGSEQRRVPGLGALLGRAEAAGGTRRGAAARPPLRRHPLGRGDVPRSGRLHPHDRP